VARFDLADDFGPGFPGVSDIAAAIERREWETRLRSAVHSRDLMTGLGTVYLGAKASDRRMRVYDLRGPVRVELQTRNDVAGRLMERVALEGSRAAHRASVASVVAFPGLRGWSAVFAA
jgi:hypothetical protein